MPYNLDSKGYFIRSDDDSDPEDDDSSDSDDELGKELKRFYQTKMNSSG